MNANTLNLVVPNNLPASACGAIVLWRLDGGAHFNKLMMALDARGITDKRLLPDLPSPEVALRRAVQAQVEPRLLVRSLPNRTGYALVRESTDAASSTDPLSYKVVLTVKATKDMGNAYEGDPQLAAAVQAAYNRNLDALDSRDVANWLADSVRILQAVALRDTGGVYFIPRTTLSLWQALTASLKEASATVCSEIPALTSDEAVAAVLDAVTREAEDLIKSMTEDIAQVGTPDGLGSRAVQTRQARAEALAQKLTAYEALLGTSLDAVRANTDGLKANLAAAYLTALASEE